MTDKAAALAAAITEAVAEGRREHSALTEVVRQCLSTNVHSSPPAGLKSTAKHLEDAIERFTAVTDSALSGDCPTTFNIAFFGRTGAGKSTLLSTLGGLDGARVSIGVSDFTTEVEPVLWHDCELWDTPGINGWGRTTSRATLETRARRAVEAADVVLLCFDSQSQQATEFAKIGAWVTKYNKPAIAVLNVRNPIWRHWEHGAVRSEEQRRSLSQTVAQHAGNIRAELVQIGLLDIPIVAYHGQRALAARASLPYRGPSPTAIQTYRDTFGVDYLNESSNIEVLEDLVIEAIASGAAELRQGSMRDTVRGAAEDLAAAYRSAFESTTEPIEALDRRARGILDAIGYPDSGDATTVRREVAAVVAAAEDARDARFHAPHMGSATNHFRHLLDAHLAEPRQQILADVSDLVEQNTSDSQPTTVADLDQIFAKHRPAAEDAIVKAWKAAGVFVYRKVELSVDDDESHAAESLLHADEDLKAHSGARKAVGWALRAVGLTGSVAAAAVPIAAANFWNPAGWVVGGAALAVGAVGGVAGHFGDGFLKVAERNESTHLAKSLSRSREMVLAAFDAIDAELLTSFEQQLWKAAAPTLTAVLTDLNATRTYAAQLPITATLVDTAVGEIKPSPDVVDVLAIASAAVVSHRSSAVGRSLTGPQVWLGEDWFTGIASRVTDHELDADARRRLWESTAESKDRLRAQLSTVWRPIDATAADEWLDEAVALLDDRSALSLFDSDVATPPVVVTGDYSAGKSSLIKRMLLEMGATASRTIQISGAAATDSVVVHDVGHIRLVDTPGFQSGREGHDRIAVEASGMAALVIVVLQVNLLVGESTLLEEIVRGSETMRAKGKRVLYVVNRSDELGSDPTIDPDEYEQRKILKASELKKAFAAKGIEVSDDQIHFVAGDPYGQCAHVDEVTAEMYDSSRSWDGIEALTGTLLGVSRAATSAGTARARIDNVSNALTAARGAIEVAIADHASIRDRAQLLDETLRNGIVDAETLHSALGTRTAKIVQEYADRAIDKVLRIAPDQSDDISEIVSDWLTDQDLTSDLKRSFTKFNAEVEPLLHGHSTAIRRDFAALASDVEEGTASTVASSGGSASAVVAEAGAHAAKFGQGAAKALGNRNAVYAIGKAVGFKFKPWGAVKGGAAVGRAAPILGAAAVALDGYAMYAGKKAADKRSTEKQSAVDAIRQDAKDYIRSVLEHSPDPAMQTANTALLEFIDEVAATRRQLLADITDADEAIAALKRGVEDIDALIERAVQLTEYKDK